MKRTKIVEVTKAIIELTKKLERKPTRADMSKHYNLEDDVNGDIDDAINAGCVTEDPETGELSVAQKGVDYVTGKVYPAKEIFNVDEKKGGFVHKCGCVGG